MRYRDVYSMHLKVFRQVTEAAEMYTKKDDAILLSTSDALNQTST
jgi:hypothetical protein